MTPDVTGASPTLPAALPGDAVLAHVGMHKTGTTAIQSVLSALRDELPPEGVTYPGEHEAHHMEARSLTRATLGWRTSPVPAPDLSVWSRFAGGIRATRGRVVFSSEFFSSASEEQIRQLDTDLDGRTQILLGVRNLGPVAVSSWQQTLKQGRVSSLEQWLKDNFVRASGDELDPKFFWAKFDPAAAVQRYADAVGGDRVTVVVMHEGDRRLLPTTFERLLDLPAGRLAEQPAPRSNRGLSSIEAEAVRRVNAAVSGRLTWDEYNRLVRAGAIRRLVEQRSPQPDETKPEVPGWLTDQLTREGTRVADTIQSTGVRVVGDLDDLRRAPTSPSTANGVADLSELDAPAVPIDILVEAVVGAIAGAAYAASSLDGPRPRRPQLVSESTAAQLARVIGGRIKNRAKRRLGRG